MSQPQRHPPNAIDPAPSARHSSAATRLPQRPVTDSQSPAPYPAHSAQGYQAHTVASAARNVSTQLPLSSQPRPQAREQLQEEVNPEKEGQGHRQLQQLGQKIRDLNNENKRLSKMLDTEELRQQIRDLRNENERLSKMLDTEEQVKTIQILEEGRDRVIGLLFTCQTTLNELLDLVMGCAQCESKMRHEAREVSNDCLEAIERLDELLG